MCLLLYLMPICMWFVYTGCLKKKHNMEQSIHGLGGTQPLGLELSINENAEPIFNTVL